MESKDKTKILFVCLGNICRSPAAEGVMKKIANEHNVDLEISSAGTISYHEGENPNSRMLKAAHSRGYTLNHKARKITDKDLEYYDLIIGMDSENIKFIKNMSSPKYYQKIKLISEYFVESDYTHVPDPYYGDQSDFDKVITLLEDACLGILKSLTA